MHMHSTSKIQNIVLIPLFAILIAICSWISIPTTIPFTMQTFGVFLALSFLGGKQGIACIVLYILLGMIGIPVYANGTAGLGVTLGPTGGYMIGWICSGLILWLFDSCFRKALWIQFLAMCIGLCVCYAIGTAWFMLFYASKAGIVGVWSALCCCVFPFFLPDIGKLLLALWFTQKLKKITQLL